MAVISNNLPVQLTSFVGRESELADLLESLSHSRLVTLTGAGGSGKTRLAIHAATSLISEYPDGVWIIELAGLSDPVLVVQEAAKVIGVQESPSQSLIQTLTMALGHRWLLLVVDNCEHLLEACASLVWTLIQACPGIRILATSQQTLGISGEVVRPVPGLSLPHTNSIVTADQLFDESDAVQLFVARAYIAQPQFRLTHENATSVASICHRMNGIPLAIELAASRVKVLTAQQIDSRLDQLFRLLTRGGDVMLPRHQTLRAAIDWSYQLLPEAARLLLRRLSVFAGDFSLTAAESVCAGDGLTSEEILDALTDLVDHSLVLVFERQSLGEARYQLLEMIRQYGQERLEEAGEAQLVQERHITFFLHLAEEAEGKLKGGEQLIWLRRLDGEYDNVREALARCIAYESSVPAIQARIAEMGLRLAGSLWLFWMMRGYLTEAHDLLERVLPKGKDAKVSVRAKGISALGTIAYNRGNMPRALASHEEALELYREIQDQKGIAFSLSNLGLLAGRRGANDQAIEYFKQSLALYQGLEDFQGMAMVLNNMGIARRDQGYPTQAADLYEEGLILARRTQDRLYTAVLLVNLGELAYDRGHYLQASARFEEALLLLQELGDRVASAFVIRILGDVARMQGDLVRAAKHFRESVNLSYKAGDKHTLAQSLMSLAKVISAVGDPHTGTRLFSAVEAIRRSLDEQLPPMEKAEYDQEIAALRAGLDEASFLQAWAAGQTMTLEQAIALVESQPIPATSTPKVEPETSTVPLLPRRETEKEKYGGLTTREREVAVQIAQGKSNQAIAGELFVGLKTVEAHVSRILSKLGFTSRAQIAGWAVAKGLAEAPRDLDTLGREG